MGETGQDSGTGLPASIEAAWGLRQRPAKGPKPGLSLDRIVKAALRIGRADGLAAVSMSRVAAELGASTMALYRYVAAKDELIALMVDMGMGPPPAAPASDEGWRAGLAQWAWAERALLRKDQWVLGALFGGLPSTPNQIAWLERGLSCLRGTGLAEHEKLSVILLITSYVRMEVALSADVKATFEASGASAQEAMSAYGHLLAKLTDAQRFPALHAVIEAGVFDREDDPDDEFVFGLDRILDGIEALVRARAKGRPLATPKT